MKYEIIESKRNDVNPSDVPFSNTAITLKVGDYYFDLGTYYVGDLDKPGKEYEELMKFKGWLEFKNWLEESNQ